MRFKTIGPAAHIAEPQTPRNAPFFSKDNPAIKASGLPAPGMRGHLCNLWMGAAILAVSERGAW